MESNPGNLLRSFLLYLEIIFVTHEFVPKDTFGELLRTAYDSATTYIVHTSIVQLERKKNQKNYRVQTTIVACIHRTTQWAPSLYGFAVEFRIISSSMLYDFRNY